MNRFEWRKSVNMPKFENIAKGKRVKLPTSTSRVFQKQKEKTRICTCNLTSISTKCAQFFIQTNLVKRWPEVIWTALLDWKSTWECLHIRKVTNAFLLVALLFRLLAYPRTCSNDGKTKTKSDSPKWWWLLTRLLTMSNLLHRQIADLNVFALEQRAADRPEIERRARPTMRWRATASEVIAVQKGFKMVSRRIEANKGRRQTANFKNWNSVLRKSRRTGWMCWITINTSKSPDCSTNKNKECFRSLRDTYVEFGALVLRCRPNRLITICLEQQQKKTNERIDVIRRLEPISAMLFTFCSKENRTLKASSKVHNKKVSSFCLFGWSSGIWTKTFLLQMQTPNRNLHYYFMICRTLVRSVSSIKREQTVVETIALRKLPFAFARRKRKSLKIA